MMNFLQFLAEIEREMPRKSYTLDAISSPNFPVILSQNDIAKLIDFALLHQPMITIFPNTKAIPMLTFLMSLGTQEQEGELDRVLGLKDARIEHEMIEKALIHAKKGRANGIKKIVFGLSGNPPTIDHLRFIQHLVEKYEYVYLVLNAQSPCKKRTDYVSADLRLEMLAEMLEAEHVDKNRYEISSVEMDRDPPSRMIATLSLLTLSSAVSLQLTLALGLDALLHFEQWYQWQRFGGLCDIKFYPRPGIVLDIHQAARVLQKMTKEGIGTTLVYHTEELKHQYQRINAQLDVPLTLIKESISTSNSSSTELRDYYSSLSDGIGNIPLNIHPVVDRKIRALQLYGYKL